MKPLRITEFSSESWGRLGGESPSISVQLHPSLRFFFSVPDIGTGNVISVFFTAKVGDVFEHRGMMVGDDATCLRILSHPQQGCRVDGMNSSTLPPHSLITLPEESDGTTEFDIWTHHKFGGNPTLEAIGTLDDSTRSDLAKGGFQFVCQLAFPDVNDAGVDANWPVCDCLFQLYRGSQTGRTRYAAVWDKL